MRRITRVLLWLFVFSVPWGVVNSFPGIGTITRLLGLVTIAAGLLTTTAEARLRKPGVIFSFALLFVIASILSLFWTISYSFSAEQARTYVQFVGLIWVVREFARTREERDSLLLAFCLGGLVVAFDLLRNFGAGVQTEFGVVRYSASEANPNYVGFSLAIGFPMAWYLFLHHRGTVRVIAGIYCLVAPLATLLTASRGAVIAGVVALSIVPLTLGQGSFGAKMKVIVVLLASFVAIGLLVPRQSWDRVLTASEEIQDGTMGGRTQIWSVAWQAFQERPLLGAGTGAFVPAVEPAVRETAHNMPLSLLVEQGIIGLCLFASVFAACAWITLRLPSGDRTLWAVLLCTWLTWGMSGDVHTDKVTWVMFGLLAAQDSLTSTARRWSEPRLASATAAGERMQRRIGAARPVRSLPGLR